MEIRKGTFLYELAYGLTDGTRVPKQTNLCTFFWRCVMMTFAWIAVLPIGMIIATVATVFGVLISGHRWDFWGREYEDKCMTRMVHWPKIRGHHLWPVFIWLPALLAAVMIFDLGGAREGTLLLLSVMSWLLLGFAMLWLVVWLLVVVIPDAIRSQPVKLLKAYIHSKTKGICPLITVVKYDDK